LSGSINVLEWEENSTQGWSYDRVAQYFERIVFELDRVPNFAEPRFKEIGEKIEERRTEIIHRQSATLRQLHGLGAGTSFTLRLRTDGNRLRLFVIARVPARIDTLEHWVERIESMFPKEYSFSFVSSQEKPELWKKAVDLSWARFVDEVIKPEEVYRSPIPEAFPYFYCIPSWQSQNQNSMESVCRSLLNYRAEAAIDIVLTPTTLKEDERGWLGYFTKEMRDAFSGKKVLDKQGRLVSQFEPIQELKAPLENNEEQLKRYTPHNFLFLYSFRIISSEDPTILTQSFTSACTRSNPQILHFSSHSENFTDQVNAATNLHLAANCHTRFWSTHQLLPWRAQRFHRLADIDEISSFWRIPIPAQAGFPGFPLDVGYHYLDEDAEGTKAHFIQLGKFTDESTGTRPPAIFDREGLNRHGLVVGVPGSGKTTAMFSILHQLWVTRGECKRIPFIVMEPAKTEYRALKTLEGFQDDLLVFSLGDERISPFRFNPFEVPTGTPLESHISRLNACFVGAFNLFDPLPLLLDKAIRETYEESGWFDDSLGGDFGPTTPTLTDL